MVREQVTEKRQSKEECQMKRLIAFVLLLCVSCSLISGSAWAVEETTEESSGNSLVNIEACQIYTRPKDETAFHAPSALIMVYDGDKLLRNSYDYRITSYSDIQNDGALMITVTGIGDYYGSVDVLTAINRAEQPLLVDGVPQGPIVCGESLTLETSGIGDIHFASDNPSIAEVDAEGRIYGTGAGVASITVSASGNQYYKPAERSITIRVIKPGQKPDSLSGENETSEIDKNYGTYLANLYRLWNYLDSRDTVQRWTSGEAFRRYEDAIQFEELRIMIEARNADEARGMTECVTICTHCGEETTTDNQFCINCGQTLQTQSGRWGQWSDWMLTQVESTTVREVERRQALVGYNMFYYRTMLKAEPNDRVFRNFSIEEEYESFHAEPCFGEEYAERYVPFSELSFATKVNPDPWNVYPGKGYQDGVTVAFDFQDDSYLWYLKNAVYKTMYRCRELQNG